MYLSGTSIALLLITKRMAEIARETGLSSVVLGSRGKGNDWTRFELGAYALDVGIQVIAPWREWDLSSGGAQRLFLLLDSNFQSQQ